MSDTPRNLGWAVAARLPELDDRLKRVNKQALKLGCPPMTYTRTGQEQLRTVKLTPDVCGELIPQKTLFVEIEIHGTIPVLPGGWVLLAVINHEEGLPIVKTVPGAELTPGQRDRGQICDHCRIAIRRKDTFVLRADDGRVVQVGRNCLADFLGVSSFKPDALLALASFLRDPFSDLDQWSDSMGDFAGGRLLIDVERVVRYAGAAIDEWGWVSKARAGASYDTVQSTAAHVSFAIFPPRNPTRDEQEILNKLRARASDPLLKDQAAAAVEWAKSKLGDTSDYLNNLGVCATTGTVGTDKLGIVVSLMATYRRELDQLRDRERQMKTAGYVGEVGKRDTFKLTLVKTPRGIDTAYGTSWRCEFSDEAGHVLVWWASVDPTFGDRQWPVGETRTVKATVKKHEEWKGLMQTTITRVTVVDGAGARAA